MSSPNVLNENWRKKAIAGMIGASTLFCNPTQVNAQATKSPNTRTVASQSNITQRGIQTFDIGNGSRHIFQIIKLAENIVRNNKKYSTANSNIRRNKQFEFDEEKYQGIENYVYRRSIYYVALPSSPGHILDRFYLSARESGYEFESNELSALELSICFISEEKAKEFYSAIYNQIENWEDVTHKEPTSSLSNLKFPQTMLGIKDDFIYRLEDKTNSGSVKLEISYIGL